jgi:hypothetical protein
MVYGHVSRGGVFFEKNRVFSGLTWKRRKPHPDAGFRKSWIYQKKSKKHEKTRKFAKSEVAESCKKRGVFSWFLQGHFFKREEGLLSIHAKTAIFDIF